MKLASDSSVACQAPGLPPRIQYRFKREPEYPIWESLPVLPRYGPREKQTLQTIVICQ